MGKQEGKDEGRNELALGAAQASATEGTGAATYPDSSATAPCAPDQAKHLLDVRE